MHSSIITKDTAEYIQDLKSLNNDLKKYIKKLVFANPLLLDFEFCKYLLDNVVVSFENLLKICKKERLIDSLLRNDEFIQYAFDTQQINEKNLKQILKTFDKHSLSGLTIHPTFLENCLERKLLKFSDVIKLFEDSKLLSDFYMSTRTFESLLKKSLVSNTDIDKILNTTHSSNRSNAIFEYIRSALDFQLDITKTDRSLFSNLSFLESILKNKTLTLKEYIEKFKEKGIDQSVVDVFLRNSSFFFEKFLRNKTLEFSDFLSAIQEHCSKSEEYLETLRESPTLSIYFKLYEYLDDASEFDKFLGIVQNSKTAEQKLLELIDYDIHMSNQDLEVLLNKKEKKYKLNI